MESNVFDSFFNEANEQNGIVQTTTAAEQIVGNVEKEFKGYSEEERSRQNEEENLKKEIDKLKEMRRKYRNIRNFRFRHINIERGKKRKEIDRKITECKIRLQEIQRERSGSQISPQTKTPSLQSISNWNAPDLDFSI